MVFLWYSDGIPMVVLWYSDGVPIVFLWYSDCIPIENVQNKQTFSTKDFIPTAGQGIIAVQCREDDEYTREVLKKINHNETEVCALAERSFLKTLGGDSDTAVGCSAILNGDNIEIKAQLFSDDGQKVFNVMKLGKSNQPQLLGKLAGEEILKKSGSNFIKKR